MPKEARDRGPESVLEAAWVDVDHWVGDLVDDQQAYLCFDEPVRHLAEPKRTVGKIGFHLAPRQGQGRLPGHFLEGRRGRGHFDA